MNLAS